MKAGLNRFLWLWLPPLAIVLAGLWSAWLTGQADPWDWALPTAIVLTGAGLLLARRGWAILTWVAMGGVGMALIFCAFAAGRVPDGMAALGLAMVGMLAAFGGAMLRHSPFASSVVEKPGANTSRLRSKRTGVGVIFLILAALLLWRGPAQPLHPVPDRPTLAVITALPLFWSESGRQDAPVVTVLRTRFTVVPMDDPVQLKPSGAKRLLLAQPRAMTPTQLVAIDAWVRDGGTALVMADPLLRWPSDLPLGDRRRAPSTSLLGPLLDHWGFHPCAIMSEEIRYFPPDGTLITLTGARGCPTAERDGIVQRKQIGHGAALLVGDADPIDDRLWLANPAHPLDPRYWVADTPALVVRWLGGASIPGDRRWMRDAQDVTRALRWALLAGTMWAIVGAMLLRRGRRGATPGTKGEDDEAKDNKFG
ncbi:Gldg family protein [Sphingobium sp. Z007]|uniref:Gldg family protein n=1 Tax=Sphingobium sp. Z007 TaxID=627495 RepID=UPI000B49C156|nr:ABC transporter [Sphingobium sp. Z007]